MAVASTTTRELSINRIVLRAFQLAGVMGEHQQLDDANGSLARDLLETIVDELQGEGIYLRTVDDYLLTVEAGETRYDVPETILSLVGTAMWIADGQPLLAAEGELPVSPIGREEWQTTGSKAAIATPSRYYQRRAAANVEVRLWPIPSADGTIRFQANYLLADNDDGNATPAFERPWAQFFIWELAHQIALAKSLPLNKARYLAGEAQMKRRKCKAYSTESVGIQAIVTHGRFR